MKKNKKKNKITKNLVNNFILWTLIIIISVTILNYIDTDRKLNEISYSKFISIINDDEILAVGDVVLDVIVTFSVSVHPLVASVTVTV